MRCRAILSTLSFDRLVLYFGCTLGVLWMYFASSARPANHTCVEKLFIELLVRTASNNNDFLLSWPFIAIRVAERHCETFNIIIRQHNSLQDFHTICTNLY
jgi:hypothetical protein